MLFFRNFLHSGVISPSLTKLDAIFISHGHYDHIGYLPEIIHQCPNTPIYATYLTQKLSCYLMLDHYDARTEDSMEKIIREENSIRQALERIQPMNYLRSFKIGTVQITFYEAGHIPGAAMILIESPREGRLLYTGDFCKASSRLTAGYCLPSNIRLNTLLMCGLHAKHPRHVVPDNLNNLLPQISRAVDHVVPCFLATRELTKGIETVSFLAEKMRNGELTICPIYVDDDIWTLSERLRENGLSVLSEQCRRFPFFPFSQEPGIYVGGYRYQCHFDADAVFTPSFSLHGSYADCSDLIQSLQPQTVVLVHSPPDRELGHYGDTALETEHRSIAFLYPSTGCHYSL